MYEGSPESGIRLEAAGGESHDPARDDPFCQVVVPDHKELDRGTLRAILRGIDFSVEEFTRLRKRS